MNKLYRGDCLNILRRLPDESVQCCVTSPPYWLLRDYGVAGQLGLEPTPESYVARMVEVFREVRRVLRDDGTLWLNIGDSYASGEVGRHDALQSIGACAGETRMKRMPGLARSQQKRQQAKLKTGLKSKDLVGIPWRLAFALQADGWYLRSDIIEEVELYCPCGCGHVMEERIWRHSPDRDLIWHKPNPMPESVRDRPTKAHEYVFLLSKSARYFWDQEAVREEQTGDTRGRVPRVDAKMIGTTRASLYATNESRMKNHRSHIEIPGGRNIRSVWTITPKPFRGAHFATFPPAMVERCVKAGTSERGCCPRCGKAWERVLEPVGKAISGHPRGHNAAFCAERAINGAVPLVTIRRDLGFRQSCTCRAAPPVPCVVLDPFIGSGTTAAVARSLGRDCIGIDLNPKYLTMARQRVKVALCG